MIVVHFLRLLLAAVVCVSQLYVRTANGQIVPERFCSQLRIHSGRWFRKGYTYLDSKKFIDAPRCVALCCERSDCDGVIYTGIQQAHQLCYLLSCNGGCTELANRTELLTSGLLSVGVQRSRAIDGLQPLTLIDFERQLNESLTEFGATVWATDQQTTTGGSPNASATTSPSHVVVLGMWRWSTWVVGAAIIGCVVMTACCLGLVAATAAIAFRRRHCRSEKLSRPTIGSPSAWVTDGTLNGASHHQGALRAYSNDVAAP